MIDFHLNIGKEAQLWHFFYFLFVYLVVIFANCRLAQNKRPIIKKQFSGDIFLIAGMLILSIAAYTQGDFYHYAELVQVASKGFAHLEDIYIWFIDVVKYNYLLWRIGVWGTAMVLLVLTAKRLGISIRYTFFILFVCYITLFSYARATLACAVYFWGLSFLLKTYTRVLKKTISIIFGLIIIWCAHYFHSSAMILIAITPILILPFNIKYIVLYTVIAFLFTGFAFSYVIDNLLSLEGEDFSVVAEKYTYSEDSEIEIRTGLSGILYYLLQYGSLIAPFLLLSICIYSQKQEHDTIVIGLYKITYGIIGASFFFLFFLDTILFFYRILFMSVIPICLEFSYLYIRGVMKRKYFLACLCWGFSFIIYWHLYGIYLRLL